MKSILLTLVALLLATGSGFAQETTTSSALRLRATSISERQANDTWGPDKEFGGVYVIKDSDNSFVFRRGDTTINWYVSQVEDLGLDTQSHQCYRLRLVDKDGDLNTVVVKVLTGDTRQLYFFSRGRAILCVEAEAID